MAETLASIKKVGNNEGVRVIRGTFQTSSSESTKVTLGFKPIFVMYYNMNPSDTPVSVVIWDSSRPNVQIYSYNNQTALAIPSSQVYLFASIDDDGFTVNKSANTSVVRYINYVAIG